MSYQALRLKLKKVSTISKNKAIDANIKKTASKPILEKCADAKDFRKKGEGKIHGKRHPKSVIKIFNFKEHC